VNGHRAYQHYLALKKHYTVDKYSVFQEPRVPVPEATYLKRNDHYLWEKFAKLFHSTPEVMTFMIANFAAGNESFVHNMEVANDHFIKWQKNSQSITHLFQSELDFIQTHCKDSTHLLEFQGASPPALLNMYLGRHVSIQTMVILNAYLNYLKGWKGSMSFLFENEIRRIDKSQGFVKFNKERVQKVIESFTDDLQIVV